MLRLLPALVLAVALAAPAQAAPVTETFRGAQIEVDPYEVEVLDLEVGIPHPEANGHITAMSVDLVDPDGGKVPIQRLMLHHIVFLNVGEQDATCDRFTAFDEQTTFPNVAQRFFAAGEERAELQLPAGYGYPLKADDTWGLTAMVMNHRNVRDRAFIEYTVTYDTDPAIQPVKPVWLDVENCRTDPVYDVRGGAKRPLHEKTARWAPAEGGRLVAGGGHLHGGGDALRVSQPGCDDRTLFESRPLWGNRDHPFYNVRPVLHEPGPVSMSGTLTRQGFPLAAGEEVELTSLYDARRPHTRVMGILISYFAKDPSVTERCGPLPTDAITAQMHPQPGRTKAPKVRVPITGLDADGVARTIRKPPGRLVRKGRRAKVKVRDFSFTRANLRVRRGAKVTWDFRPLTLHNVTLASGPLGFSSKNLSDGRRYSRRLTRRGTYRLYCGLHPVSMTQRIVVR